MTLPSAQDVIDLTGSSLPAAVVTALISDAVLIGGDCLDSLDDETRGAAVKWLAAHLVSSTGEGVAQSEKLGDASVTYSRAQMGEALSGTTYGQQAIALAPCLRRIGRGIASLEVI